MMNEQNVTMDNASNNLQLGDFHGQPACFLSLADGATAVVSLLGAQVLSWCTNKRRTTRHIAPDESMHAAQNGRQEHLFVSRLANVDGQQPPRGGIPVCFPAFDYLGAEEDLPRHGFVRYRRWRVVDQGQGKDFVFVTLRDEADSASLALWPHKWAAELTVMLEAGRLTVELFIDNTGSEAFTFTAGLNTHVRVAQVEDVSVSGLFGLSYFDGREYAEEADVARSERAVELQLDDVTDRRYHALSDRALLLNAAHHSLGMQQNGFADFVLWQPWEEGAARMPDMAIDEWCHFIGLRSAALTPQHLPANEQWVGRQILAVV